MMCVKPRQGARAQDAHRLVKTGWSVMHIKIKKFSEVLIGAFIGQVKVLDANIAATCQRPIAALRTITIRG